MIEALHRLSSSRRDVSVLVGFATLLSLPSLWAGLFLDDYHQRLVLLGAVPSGLFDFFSRGTPVAEAQFAMGLLPWWSHPDQFVRFFRPLAEVLMRLDYALWPNNFVLQHAHSVLWLALTTLAAVAVHRRVLGATPVAFFAGLIFVLDPSHAGAVSWLANRNAFAGMAFALAALGLYARPGLARAWLGLVPYTLALGFGEAALALAGYLLAHELVLSQAPIRQRLMRLAPYALVSLVFLGVRAAGGYGAYLPDIYVDPGARPWAFLSLLPERAMAYLVGWFALPLSDILGMGLQLPEARTPTLAYMAVVLLALGALFWRPVRQSAQAQFYLIGLLVALVPIAASAPFSRSLWYVGFGASGLLAIALQALRSPRPAGQPRWVSWGLWALFVVHIPLALPMHLALGQGQRLLDQAMDSQTVGLPTQARTGRVLVLAVPSQLVAVTFPWLKDMALSLGDAPQRPAPQIDQVLTLVETEGELTVARPEANTLVVSSAQGFPNLGRAYGGVNGGMRGGMHRGMYEGLEISSPHWVVTILEASPDGRPLRIQFRLLDSTLQDWQVLAWTAGRLMPADLPAVGGSARYRIGQTKPE